MLRVLLSYQETSINRESCKVIMPQTCNRPTCSAPALLLLPAAAPAAVAPLLAAAGAAQPSREPAAAPADHATHDNKLHIRLMHLERPVMI